MKTFTVNYIMPNGDRGKTSGIEACDREDAENIICARWNANIMSVFEDME